MSSPKLVRPSRREESSRFLRRVASFSIAFGISALRRVSFCLVSGFSM